MTEGDDPSAGELSADGTALRAGWFRFYFADERWEWSPEVDQIHGYEPGSVTVTTDLVMAHKYADDKPKMAALLDQVRQTRAPISSRHRIIDTQGRTRDVVVVGEQLHDDLGEVVGTHGYYLDVTPTLQDAISDAIAEIATNRGVIEQTKGMLMLIYRLDANKAFDILKWRSQETNVKLRPFAEQLAADFLELAYDEILPPRAAYDHLLLTAHQRVTAA
ncbi:putative PAS/PAC sensor protein [Mycobacterium lentiflavum]|uniref:Putative PAS/PAC sensor protein n=1 Tax=Mycobacterium lentiflavum TaxID=141349 RepID=A0A0E4CP91_MYCLN|nr:putative PAS/PAC sensor protein [Mycobacterium lentiflavum]